MSDVRVSARITKRRRDANAACVGVTVEVARNEYTNALTGWITPEEAIAIAQDLMLAASASDEMTTPNTTQAPG